MEAPLHICGGAPRGTQALTPRHVILEGLLTVWLVPVSHSELLFAPRATAAGWYGPQKCPWLDWLLLFLIHLLDVFQHLFFLLLILLLPLPLWCNLWPVDQALVLRADVWVQPKNGSIPDLSKLEPT